MESDDVTGSMLQALNGIGGGAPLECEFRVPEMDSGQDLDLDKVNVRYIDPDDTFGVTVRIGHPSLEVTARMRLQRAPPRSP